MAIFNSYVSLPEGNSCSDHYTFVVFCLAIDRKWWGYVLPKLKVDIFAGHERLAGAWRTVPGGPGAMVGYPTPTLTLRLPSRRSACFKKLAATPLATRKHPSGAISNVLQCWGIHNNRLFVIFFFFFSWLSPAWDDDEHCWIIYIYTLYLRFSCLRTELLSAKHSSSCSRSKLSIVGHGRPVLHPDVLYLYIQKYEGMSYLSFYVHR